MFKAIVLGVSVLTAGLAAQGPASAPGADLGPVIDRLGSFDLQTRTNAARDIRRASPPLAGAALEHAVRTHHDEYVRFRALVLLSGFGDPATGALMRDMLGDKDDRVRTVVYQWFEVHTSNDVLPQLIASLSSEHSEFVRPALTRAIAAHAADPRVRAVLTPLVMRGEDLFRGSVIAALGDYAGSYALDDIVNVAKLDGPLQDDAVTAMGKIGGASVKPALLALQKSVPREEQPTIAAALCLIDVECAAEKAYLKDTLAFAATNDDYQALLRGAVHGLDVLAIHGDMDALQALFDRGVSARDEARAPIALGVGEVAFRKPELVLRALEQRPDSAPAIELLRDAFDELSSEDFDEEMFYVATRAAYWDAPADSVRRHTAEAVLDALEF